MGDNPTTAGPSLGAYIPPKMWKDLTSDEKIERTRVEMKKFFDNIYYRLNEIDNLKNDFQNHSHSEGKVVKDVKTYNSIESNSAKLGVSREQEEKGEVYF